MNDAVFYIAVVGFTFGIFIQSLFPVGLYTAVWILLLSFVLSVIWSRKRTSVFKERSDIKNKQFQEEVFSARYILYLSVFLFVATFGMLRMDFAQSGAIDAVRELQVDTQVILEGTVRKEVDRRETSAHIYLRTDKDLVLIYADPFIDVTYGDRLEVKGILGIPKMFETDLGKTFNYPGYLHARGVTYVVQYPEIVTLEKDKGNPIVTYLLRAKHAFMHVIEQTISEPQAGLAEGLLLGVKRALGEDLETAFRKTGIIHIVVLSGYNIMLVVAFTLYILSFLLPFRVRLIAGIISIIAFALIVGLSATVVRASIMVCLALVALGTSQSYAVLRALCLAGVAMLVINPYLLSFDVGFQLSFIATLGLILLSPILDTYLRMVPSVLGLRSIVGATLSTQIFVLPILMYQIGEVSVVSVIVNLLVLPMVPIAMLLTFITGIVGSFSSVLAIPVAYIATVSLSYILNIATLFAGVPFASIVVPKFPFVGMVCFYAVLGIGLYWCHKKQFGVKETGQRTAFEAERETAVSRSDTAVPTPIFFR